MVIEDHLLRGGGGSYGKNYLEILVDQNTRGDNFCKFKDLIETVTKNLSMFKESAQRGGTYC